MFMLKFTEFLVMKRELSECTQAKMDFYRNKMVVELYLHAKFKEADVYVNDIEEWKQWQTQPNEHLSF